MTQHFSSGDQEVPLHKVVVPPMSETSSETEPQTTTEPAISQPHRAHPRHLTRSSSSRIGAPRLDSYGDSVTAIRLPISQEITSPTQLGLAVQNELANAFSTKPEDHIVGRTLEPTGTGSAKNQTHSLKASTKSRTTSSRHRPSQVCLTTNVTERAHISAANTTRRRRASEASSVKSTGKSTTPPRTLRPRLSEVSYKW